MNLPLKVLFFPAITCFIWSGANAAALEEDSLPPRRSAIRPSAALERDEKPKRIIVKPAADIKQKRGAKKLTSIASLKHAPREEKIITGIKRSRDAAEAEPEEKATSSKGASKASRKTPFTEEDIMLKEGKKGKDTFYWHIEADGARRGYVSISPSSGGKLGKHCSIQVFINKKDQGKHLGSIAYKLACLNSGLDVVYAHMRKNNKPSMKAAQNAGFKVDPSNPTAQLTMKWIKPK